MAIAPHPQVTARSFSSVCYRVWRSRTIFCFFSGAVSCATSPLFRRDRLCFLQYPVIQAPFNEIEDSGNGAGTLQAFFGSLIIKITQMPAYFGNFLRRDEKPLIFFETCWLTPARYVRQ